METIIIEKKVLFDLISHVAMVAANASTGVICTDEVRVPEQFAFYQSDKLPYDLREHVELVLKEYIAELIMQPNVLKGCKSLMCHVNQAVRRDFRNDLHGARLAINLATNEASDVLREIFRYSANLHNAGNLDQI